MIEKALAGVPGGGRHESFEEADARGEAEPVPGFLDAAHPALRHELSQPGTVERQRPPAARRHISDSGSHAEERVGDPHPAARPPHDTLEGVSQRVGRVAPGMSQEEHLAFSGHGGCRSLDSPRDIVDVYERIGRRRRPGDLQRDPERYLPVAILIEKDGRWALAPDAGSSPAKGLGTRSWR